MDIDFQISKRKGDMSPYFFHVLPIITLMSHPLGSIQIYSGWLIFQITIRFKP